MSASTESPALVRVSTPGNARPISSAVRDEPTTLARNRLPWQCGQRQPTAGRPHHRQDGAEPGPVDPSGPAQCAQWAGRRSLAQASAGR